jgi:hypothetical protein
MNVSAADEASSRSVAAIAPIALAVVVDRWWR